MQIKIIILRFFSLFLFLNSSLLYSVDSVNEFFSNEVMWHIRKNLTANIASDTGSFPDAPHPDTGKAETNLPGSVVIAPFIKDSENNSSSCLYMSQRIAAITMLSIIEELKSAIKIDDQNSIDQYGSLILDYISFWQYASAQKNFSPGIDRFYLSGKPVIDWLSPQNDSHALTSLVMSDFAALVLFSDKQLKIKNSVITSDFITQNLISADGKGLINLNLSYIVDNSRKDSYDMWESCFGEMFSTRIVQMKALCAGSALSAKTGNISLASKYISTADMLIKSIHNNYQEFSYKTLKFRTYCEMAALPQNLIFPLYPKYRDKNFDKYRGMSINSSLIIGALLGNLYEYSLENSWVSESLAGDAFLQLKFNSIVKTYIKKLALSSVKMLKTSKLLAEYCFSENGLDAYKINENLPPGISLLGRYPGDLFNGAPSINIRESKGNPWFVCSLALAQYYYSLSYELKNSSYKTMGDKQMALIFKYLADKDKKQGRAFTMSQQIDRNTGSNISISDYTWSYAQYLLTYHASKLSGL